MNSYTLSRSALRGAAPTVLGVVFGPDGSFEGVPRFCPPLRNARAGSWSWGWLWEYEIRGEDIYTTVLDQDLMVEGGDLDLRISSIFTHITGLCARALGFTEPATWTIQDEGNGVYALYGIPRCLRSSFEAVIVLRWDNGRAMGHGTGGAATHPNIGGAPFGSPEHFLATLALALATQIAALKETS